VFKKRYENNIKLDSNNIDDKIKVKSYEQCIPKKYKHVSKCKMLNGQCDSNISFNIIVCHWKKAVADMITNMQKRRYNFVQHSKARNRWQR